MKPEDKSSQLVELNAVSILPVKHKAHCAVYDPTPSRCDCRPNLRVAVKVSELELAHRDAQPAVAQGEAVVWVNSANIKSAAISQERGGPFEQHTWSESKTAYHDVPIRVHEAPAVAQPHAGAVNEKVKSTLENVALIAHHGGLIDLSESDALFLIRKITRSWNDPKPDPRQKKVALTAIAAAEASAKGVE